MKLLSMLIVILCVLIPVCLGADIYVPDDYLTIQNAINASSDNDTIWVGNGIYSGSGQVNLEFQGKAITLRSINGNENCIIDGEDTNRCFYLHEDETLNTQIIGFTIRNGYDASSGGGMECNGASVTVRDCIFENCYAPNGGAVNVQSAYTIFHRCIFTENTASAGGGAILTNESIDLVHCQFILNSLWDIPGTKGGAVFTSGGGNIFNCLFVANNSYGFGGAIYTTNTPLNITNCTFYGNMGTFNMGEALYSNNATTNVTGCIFHVHISDPIMHNTVQPTVTYSDVEQNGGVYPGTGNINEDPLFWQTGLRECQLSQVASGQSSDSPCLDAGHDMAASVCYAVYAECLDLETTRSDQVPDMGTVDMGYHYPTDIQPMTPTPTPTMTPTNTPTATPTEIPEPCGPDQTPYVELEAHFEEWPLTDWTIQFEGVDGNWTNNFNVGAPNYAGGDGYCLVAGSMYTTTFVTTTCTSPGFSLLDFNNAYLDFFASFDNDAVQADYFRVQFSGTGAAPFTTILEWDEDHSPNGPGEFIRLDLSDYCGLYDDCVIRFLYTSPSGFVSRAMFDQVQLTACYGDSCVNDGDTNQDGDITAGDAQLAFNIVLGSYSPTYEEACAADCNGDDTVTAADAQAIFLKVLGSGSCADDQI